MSAEQCIFLSKQLRQVFDALSLLEQATSMAILPAFIKAIPPDAPLEPLTPYGASKAAAFQMMRTFAMSTGIELFYGRIFHSYGNGQFEGNFWASLFRAALDGNDFPMTTGRQIMDFIPISDVTHHLLTACTRSDISPGKPFVVNIGSGVQRPYCPLHSQSGVA